jgi:hypothetical protein
MANTFKVVSHDVMPATSGTPEALYATPGSTTTVVIGLILANIHTAQVTASVILVSDTSGGGRVCHKHHDIPCQKHTHSGWRFSKPAGWKDCA